MTLSRWLVALFLLGLFYAPIMVSAVQVWQLYIAPMPAQPLPPSITEPRVALQLAAARDDAEHDLNDRFSPVMKTVRETSRLLPYMPPTSPPPRLQDQGKRVTVGVVAGRKSTR
jgi:hypothetical protein